MHRVATLSRKPELLVGFSAFALATLVAVWIVRPIHSGTLGYDAAASVLYAQRLLAGQRLEAFVGATPKALLTVVYGLVYGVLPDWRLISGLAIVAYAAGIAASAALAYRLSGIVAAAFVTVGLIGSAELLMDVDLAYAVGWALPCWAAAGLLVTAARPRYGWAGVALAIGGLARFETLIIVGLAGVVLAIGAVLARLAGRPTTAFTIRVPVLLGFLALPLQSAHDWLLTGDPLYAEKVPVLGSVGLPLVGVAGVVRSIGTHYAGEPALVVLAVVGIAILAVRARWDIVVGLVALTVGVAAFLGLLAIRGIYVSGRYIAPADLALIFAAGIGISALRIPALAAALRDRPRGRSVLAIGVVIGALAALAIVRPFGPLDRVTRSAIIVNGRVHRDIDQMLPQLRVALAAIPGIRDRPTVADPTRPMGEQAALLAPILTVPQLAVSLDLPLSALSGTVGTSIRDDGSYPRPGQLVLHQVDRDRPPEAFKRFEVDEPAVVGDLIVDPLAVGPDGRSWLVRIRR